MSIARDWWLMRFEIAYLRAKSSEFETLFTRVMEFSHPGDFTQVRPWGNIGDQKCDGWLASDRRLFQVYAPDELTRAATEKKMTEDFAGAMKHWGGRFLHWTFVHNSETGVPSFVLQKTQALAAKHPGIGFVPWGYAELREKVVQLREDHCVTLFGFAPSEPAMQSVRYADIAEVLPHVASGPVPDQSDLRPVPKEKLDANALSDEVQEFIRLGMRKSRLVGDFFRDHANPRFGDAMAYHFSQRYQEFKGEGLEPDEIFWRLRAIAGVPEAKSDKEEAAALAVLAHFFEECDIFERPETLGMTP